MTLDEYMTETGLSAEEIGRKLGCSGQAVRRWRGGQRMPEPPMVEKIRELTDGRVDVAGLHQACLRHLRGTDGEAA